MYASSSTSASTIFPIPPKKTDTHPLMKRPLTKRLHRNVLSKETFPHKTSLQNVTKCFLSLINIPCYKTLTVANIHFHSKIPKKNYHTQKKVKHQ